MSTGEQPAPGAEEPKDEALSEMSSANIENEPEQGEQRLNTRLAELTRERQESKQVANARSQEWRERMDAEQKEEEQERRTRRAAAAERYEKMEPEEKVELAWEIISNGEERQDFCNASWMADWKSIKMPEGNNAYEEYFDAKIKPNLRKGTIEDIKDFVRQYMEKGGDPEIIDPIEEEGEPVNVFVATGDIEHLIDIPTRKIDEQAVVIVPEGVEVSPVFRGGRTPNQSNEDSANIGKTQVWFVNENASGKSKVYYKGGLSGKPFIYENVRF